MTQYSRSFFENISSGSLTSAEVILTVLAQHASFSSCVDVGCGAATWMEAAARVFSISPNRLLGIDGPYSAPMHRGKSGVFHYQDLANPIAVTRNFDLAICVEVAEHLDISRAAGLVHELCAISETIVFGAAIPGQGGTGHVNEQWPSFWMSLFESRGYRLFDPFRPVVWNNARVAPWYAQNCFLLVRDCDTLKVQLAPTEIASPDDWRLRLVHPEILRLAACETAGASRLLKALPTSIATTLSRRMSASRG